MRTQHLRLAMLLCSASKSVPFLAVLLDSRQITVFVGRFLLDCSLLDASSCASDAANSISTESSNVANAGKSFTPRTETPDGKSHAIFLYGIGSASQAQVKECGSSMKTESNYCGLQSQTLQEEPRVLY